jgi:aspartate carbamoyltransferase catalytic subunit
MESSERPQRHLLTIESLAQKELDALIRRACELADGARPEKISAAVANLFFEPSTRTRVSFELAAARLGMTMVSIELDRSSSTKGESLEDTAATLAAMGIDGLVLRHPETGRPQRLAREVSPRLHLLNGGDGTGEHPSQALLDAATLVASGLDLGAATIAIVGDIRHSRVARSGLQLLSRLSVGELRIAGPAELLPEVVPVPGVIVCHSLDEALENADVVMMLRVQRERMDAAGWPDQAAYHGQWGLVESRLARAAPGCRVMHPGPINRGMEIAAAVADGPRSLILDQVRMGVFMRMAIFEWMFED